MVFVKTKPNTPSSQNSPGPLLQEVQPQGTSQTSQCKPSQLGAADMAFSQASANDWAHIKADALMLAPDISIYPNNVSMNNDDSSSDNQSKLAPVNKSLAPNLRANYQLTGFGSSSFDLINKVSSNHDSPSVSQSSQSDFGPGNNGFAPAAKANQHPGCVGHLSYISNVNGAPNLSRFRPAVWLNYELQVSLLGIPMDLNVSPGPMGFTWTR
ncbi:hypothetical protein DSO57_1030480 [Entomophthora muscae]|uniref:Uncharacterized protein n=1 Tax=Entomophthora muscae TaxID=34485 RepID=A0ACC2SE03_9FUNG|nr:hypothetical protein DSO57_1030480 [Entomophthora muscae]